MDYLRRFLQKIRVLPSDEELGNRAAVYPTDRRYAKARSRWNKNAARGEVSSLVNGQALTVHRATVATEQDEYHIGMDAGHLSSSPI